MNKAYFIELANYNIWANNIVIQWLQQITHEQYSQKTSSSFATIHETIMHMAGAEKLWLERFENKENIVFLPTYFTGTKEELIEIWQNASANLMSYIQGLQEENLATTFTFKRFGGEVNTMRYVDCLAHVFNHATYHRGQLVTMLRTVGFKEVCSTDMLNYFREKNIN